MQENFQIHFPLTYQLLRAWFSDADYEDLRDQEIINEYKKVSKSERLASLIREMNIILQIKNIDKDYISNLSSVYFEDKNDLFQWLNELYTYLTED
ncbi:contact-dependent growth inhibition system immunity protein [Acinetobacter baumannii]|nr:contact-dependent growth inhibition system immunity protein [Acinetobacter baumannii]